MDYFALLPPEITQLIFDNLRPFDTAVRLPLSRSLVPFQQRRLFRRISITKLDRFEQICQAPQLQSSPLRYVESLFAQLLPWGPTDDHHRPLWKPTNSALALFFGSLVQLRALTVAGMEQAIRILLNPIFAASSLPNLTSLSLNTSWTDFTDPFDPVHYAAIPHYANLRFFRLEDSRRPSRLLPSPNPSASLDLPRITVRCLSLAGPLTTCEKSVQQLLASFGDLETLCLTEASETSHLYNLLDGVENRAGLKQLVLDHSYDYNHRFHRSRLITPPPNGDLGPILLQFPCLSSLKLGSLCDATSPSFYDALRQVSLDHLAFGKGVELLLANLTQLIANGGMQHKLKTITFDIVEGERGTRIEDVGRPYDDDEIDGWNVYPDWIEPRWTEDFAEADLVDLIKVAKREGIEVKGTAVEAIGIIREIELEYEKLDENNHRREVITGW
ncbi:hypothetical protein JCM5353_008278 [Sporobolomyces roseus]